MSAGYGCSEVSSLKFGPSSDLVAGTLQGWDALAEYPHIVTFLDAMKGRESWGPSAPVDDRAVVNGWQHKLEKLKSS